MLMFNIRLSKQQLEYRPTLYKKRKHMKQSHSPHVYCVLSLRIDEEKLNF